MKLKRMVVVLVLLALILPATGFAGPSEEAVVADLFVRPLGFACFLIGSTVFVVTLPVSVLVGGTDNMAEVLVKRPYRFTFERDMGEGLEISHPSPDR